MSSAILVWALWVGAGGKVNSGYLVQPYVAAYFATAEECAKVQEILRQQRQAQWTQCIQARYVVPAGGAR